MVFNRFVAKCRVVALQKKDDMDAPINFNDYSTAERYQIITEILKKASKDCNGAAAKRFFEYYITKFFKLPSRLRNDIAYCQRAMKTYMQVHQLVVQVFSQQEDADPIAKDKILQDIEDTLYEINAECSFLTMLMREHINDFCAVFKEHGVDYDNELTRAVVIQEITPLVCNMEIDIKPINVIPRESKDELIQRFFTVNQEDASNLAAAAPLTTPEVIETVNISDDEDNDANATANVAQKQPTQKQSEVPVLTSAQRAVQQGAIPKKKAASKQAATAVGRPKIAATSAAAAHPKQQQEQQQEQQQKDGPSTSKGKISKQQKSAGQQPVEAKSDQVRASRLNFLQVLNRTRNELIHNEVPGNGAKSGTKTSTTTKQQQLKQPGATKNKVDDMPQTAANDQNKYLRELGLCTPNEHKRLSIVQTQVKLRSYNNNRFNKN